MYDHPHNKHFPDETQKTKSPQTILESIFQQETFLMTVMFTTWTM